MYTDYNKMNVKMIDDSSLHLLQSSASPTPQNITQ